MARSKSIDNPNNIFTSNKINVNDDGDSRLDSKSKLLRESLLSRNLYTKFDQYPLDETNRQKIVNSVGSILDIVGPFNSDISTSALSRLISTPNTPLTDIGLVMLTKQFTLNFKSNVQQKALPVLNVNNIFDGNPDTKLFQRNEDYRITIDNDESNIDTFIQRYLGYTSPNETVFRNNVSNRELLQNTGSAQLNFLFGNNRDSKGGLNKNIYKPTTPEYVEIAEANDIKISSRFDTIISTNKTYFTSLVDSKFNPYFNVDPYMFDSVNQADIQMRNSSIDVAVTNETQEYAPNIDYIENNFGRTDNSNILNAIDALNNIDEYNDSGFNENINDRLVWGRDGITDKTNERLSQLRGDNVDFTSQDTKSAFNIRTGLLEYTRNLVNATRGNLVDQTRKVYKDGLSGSGLWESPDGAKGKRQHSVLDPYDNFTKAIRFNGNNIYNGNKDSVIYNNVIPRIHPTQDSNENLMFSIENLAVVAVGGDENFGIIDDEYGTQIPRSEVGENNGRMLWFPPYNISVNEISDAKYETTTMIGRSEPLYSYQYTERSANLSFSLLVDYPEQLRNYYKNGNYKSIAEFFAFGGDPYTPNDNANNVDKKIDDNAQSKQEIKGRTKQKSPQLKENSIKLYFPNDYPNNSGNVSAIDNIYSNIGYELQKNSKLFYNTDNDTYNPSITQSTFEFDPNNPSRIDQLLLYYFSEEDNINFYEINIISKSTKLYTGLGDSNEFNKELSDKRANATKAFIEARIKKVLGTSNDVLGININVNSLGDSQSSPELNDPNKIDDPDAINERISDIRFNKRRNIPEEKESNINSNDVQDIETLDNQSAINGTQKSRNKNRDSIDSVMNSRDNINGKLYLEGYKSVTDNYFYPLFHSQTPEDFHRRLTFLHQCTRQGSSIKDDENSIKNSAFGRQPICVLRIGDFLNTKVIIQNVTIDFDDTVWDLNPEGFGLQPMIANVTLQMKVLGGQSLSGPIDALQNAVSFNYYANSTFRDTGVYRTANEESDLQTSYNNGLNTDKVDKFKRNLENRINNQRFNNIYNYNVNEDE